MGETERRRRRWRRSPRRTPSELVLERLDRRAERRLAEWRASPETPERRAIRAVVDRLLDEGPAAAARELDRMEQELLGG